MTLQDYLRDPCGTLSIPYWKNKTVQVPNFMRIVHARDYDTDAFAEYTDEPYFRLKHDLHDIPLADKRFICRTAGEDDLPLMAEIINRSYTDLSVTVEQLQGYRNTPAFAPDLWIIVQDAASGEMRAKYDYATARAVARLNILAEYCIPLLKVNGVFLPMKAKSGAEELDEAKNAFSTLHAEVIFSNEFYLTDTKNVTEPQSRLIAGIRKNAPTEKIYPRNNSQIKKKPL